LKRKLWHSLVLFILVIMLMTGCNIGNDTTQDQKEETPKLMTPEEGGEIFLPVIQFTTLNPIVNENQSVYFLNQLIFEGLLALDNSQKAQPSLATGWNVSYDGNEILFDLRDDVTWHDGKPFTAEDVEFTIETLRSNSETNNKSIYSYFLQSVKEVEVINNSQISIRFDSPLQNQLEVFTFPIIAKHQFENIENAYQALNIIPVGTGPFEVESVDRHNEIRLVKNNDYWGTKPYLHRVTAKIVPDQGAVLTSVFSDKIDVAQARDYDWKKFAGDRTIKKIEYVTQEYEFLGFNFNNNLLSDNNIRKAIALGMDRHKITEEVYLGHATVTDVPVHPNSFLFSQEAQTLGYDPVKAKEYLANSNWINRNNDEWLENEIGDRLTINLLVNNNNLQRVKTADLMAQQLKNIGIEVFIENVNWEEYESRLYNNNFDVILGGWKLSLIPDLRTILHSSFINSSNFINYSNPVMDQLLDEAALAKDQDIRVEKYHKIQQEFVRDLPYFSLFYRNSSLIVKNHIKGSISPNYYNIYHGLAGWYVNEK